MAISLFSFIKKIILALFCFWLSATSYAIVVEGIYTTVLQVQSQQSHNRESTFNDALMDVLLKASGDKEVLQNHQIISQLFPAEQYVVSFSYTENPSYAEYIRQQSLDSTSGIARTQAPLPYLIEVNFSESALESAMKNFQIPIWGSVRPNIMLWVVTEEDGKRQMLGQTTQNPLMKLLESEAARFALPVAFPFADQLDRSAVQISNLWGLFPDAVDRAKARYKADGQVMLRVYKSLTNTWNANWSLSINGESYRSSISDVDLSKLSESVIAHVAGVLVERFSIKPDQALGDGAVKIEVTDILSFQDFIGVQTFLEKLAPVKHVSLDWVEGSALGLSLTLNTNSVQFFEYLNLSGKLIKLNQAIDATRLPVSPVDAQTLQSTQVFPVAERFKWQRPASDLTPN